MREREEVERRLKKLCDRYKTKHVQKSQNKLHKSCVHNQLHIPTSNVKTESAKSWETSLSPRHQVTLIVLQPESPVGICMYGSEKPGTWNGDLCDDDATSASCPLFVPSQTRDEAEAEFEVLLRDDEYVLSTYPDVAALQWVLQSRAWSIPEDVEASMKQAAERAASAAEIALLQSEVESLRARAASVASRSIVSMLFDSILRLFRRKSPPGLRSPNDSSEDT